MSQFFILAQTKTTARALAAWLELLGEPPVRDLDKDNRVVIQKEKMEGGKERAILAYESLVRQIEIRTADQHGEIPLNEVVILVDRVKPIALNPLVDGSGWDALLGMLILTFPEIYWVFGVISDTSKNNLSTYHTLSSLLARPRRDQLFDATGLRSYIRARSNVVSPDTNLPIRHRAAAAIDEEANYALFHAYAAYRFGYRADAVRSWALMDYLFGKAPDNEGKPHDFDLLFEDVNLNFPDKPGRVHLSSFAKIQHNDGETGRAEHCPMLIDNPAKENSKYRVIVTSGHSGADADKMRSNRSFIESYKGKGRCGFVLKPVGGMFDLWNKAKLFARLDPKYDPTEAGRYRGQAPFFFWPPPPTDAEVEAGGHSAPGKLMLIAQHLVRRADALRDTANTVDECIRGAILATDALELLCYQTPTLALQALCLKHEFEVKAEVAFLGVGYHFDLKRRLDEMERDVKSASHYFHKRRCRAAELDTLVSIGNRLMLAFREAGQFDEEQYCLARIRTWHRLLRFRQTRNPIEQLANAIMAYAEFLLAKPSRYIVALCIWYVALVGLWWVLVPVENVNSDSSPDEILSAASAAWNAFAVANPGEAKSWEAFALNVIGSTAGLFHLGVFISYLYSVVTRK
ncbi:MAG: hypothetical protein BWK76_08180 [Desulfobulbaceae bacterium A2]|nr:MAG: hypothetical protein BWK76_08180 [Desulfobulbaceae bacterium A2]